MTSPINGASAQASVPVRIIDLDQVANESISDSMVLAIDFAVQTLKVTWQQLQRAVNPFQVPYTPTGGTTETTVGEALDEIFTAPVRSHVGMIIHTFSSSTPADLGYSGTWAKLASDVSIRSAGAPDLTPQGDNNPVMPVPLHGHSATSSFSGGAIDPHTHTFKTQSFAASIDDVTKFSVESSGGTNNTTSSAGGGGITGSVDTDVQDSGTSGATLNVRGLYVEAVIWHRTA